MTKKGEAHTILMYIVGLLIASLILVMGYKGIASITSSADQGAIEQFKNTLKNDIDTGSSFGRQATRDYQIPGNFQKICFASKSKKGLAGANTGNALVDDEIESNTANTVFLITEDNELTGFETEPIDFQGAPACVTINNNKIKLRMNGKGDYTSLSEVQITS